MYNPDNRYFKGLNYDGIASAVTFMIRKYCPKMINITKSVNINFNQDLCEIESFGWGISGATENSIIIHVFNKRIKTEKSNDIPFGKSKNTVYYVLLHELAHSFELVERYFSLIETNHEITLEEVSFDEKYENIDPEKLWLYEEEIATDIFALSNLPLFDTLCKLESNLMRLKTVNVVDKNNRNIKDDVIVYQMIELLDGRGDDK